MKLAPPMATAELFFPAGWSGGVAAPVGTKPTRPSLQREGGVALAAEAPTPADEPTGERPKLSASAALPLLARAYCTRALLLVADPDGLGATGSGVERMPGPAVAVPGAEHSGHAQTRGEDRSCNYFANVHVAFPYCWIGRRTSPRPFLARGFGRVFSPRCVPETLSRHWHSTRSTS